MFESLDNEDGVKVVDFGFARLFDPKKMMNEVLGTPSYMAPEIVKKEKYGSPCDIWAIGVITYQILSGSLPFPGKTNK